MGNMSYCRFQNTANDLQECIDELFSYGVDDDMSMRELKALKKMMGMARDILDYTDDVEDAIKKQENY